MTKRRRLIQVAWKMSADGTEERELKAIKDAREEINVNDCTIVTLDDERESDGVKIVPVWKWCLEHQP